MAGFSLLLLITLLNAVIASDPLVTLQHGGQLRGKSFDYDGLNIDLFLGIPFADAPTGPLRFQKPRPPRPWTGVRDAVTHGHFCAQAQFNFSLTEESVQVIGNEDCLYMDITVPGGVSTSTKKPVMVWIHGGGYTIGSKDDYPAATIAKHGDVIVVAINYRLAALGFLSDGPGTGNYGLWDQRAALIWLQDNIAAFGGDPDMITIFGESAGAGSVAALMMGQHNDGLFKRAIQESGSLFQRWSWFSSERQRHELIEEIRRKGHCSTGETVYECLREKTVEEIFALIPVDIYSSIIHPEPDQDFFSANVIDESYIPTRRFDLLSGFNKQESADTVFLPTFANKTQEPIDDGLSMEYITIYLTDVCKQITPDTVDWCVNFFTDLYALNSTDDDIERGLRLSFAAGEIDFNADMVRQLKVHSQGPKSTYGYQFSEKFPSPPAWPGVPSWAKVSATHGDELPFVFGTIYNKENNFTREYFEPERISALPLILTLMNAATDSDKPLTDTILTMWTNFAKSGDPNKPMSLPVGIPEWPEFDTTTNKFMDLNSTNTQVITTPHKDRLDQVISTFFPARTAQFKGDVVKVSPTDPTKKGDGKDTVVG